MRTKIKCPICGNNLILLGMSERGILERASPTIELFCDNCFKVFFIRLKDLKGDSELNLLDYLKEC